MYAVFVIVRRYKHMQSNFMQNHFMTIVVVTEVTTIFVRNLPSFSSL